MARGQYDDAWTTPGWTAQNMAYPPSDMGDEEVPPVGVNVVTVTGVYKGITGRSTSGAVTFTPPVRRINVSGQQVTVHKVMARLDPHGKLSVRLPVVSGNWHIRQRIGADVREFEAPITADVDMSTLVPA